MVIHWSVTYKRHRGGIYSLSSTALLRGVLRPGEAARDQQQQISHPSDFPLPFSPPQRQAAQPALPATEIFPGFASTQLSPSSVGPWERVWFLGRRGCGWMGKEKGAFAAAAAGLKGGLAWEEPEGKWEYLSSASLACEWLTEELCQMHLFFLLLPEVLGPLNYSPWEGRG